MKTMKRSISWVVLAFLFAFILVGSVSVKAADTDYIATWTEYAKENEPAGDVWTWNEVTDAIEIVLRAGVEAKEAGDNDTAYQAGLDGYYGYYDANGFENLVHGISGSRVSQTELLFSQIRTLGSDGSVEDYEAKVEELMEVLHTDANILDGVSDSDSSSDTSSSSSDTSSSTDSGSSGGAGSLVFAACFGIILREGFEAIIVVGAIIAYLQVRVKNNGASKKKTLYPVYAGSILGIVASFVTAFILNALLLANSTSQEIIEGVTALIAFCVLFYVCNWMLHRTETEAWSKYIKSKTTSATEQGSVMALAFTAFLSVYREGAEVVLFFQPYLVSGDHMDSVWGGLILGAVALVFVYLIIHVLSVGIPIKPFFTATSILMAVMCVSFLGAGIKELIEGGGLTAHSPIWLQWIPYNDALDILGIYPLLETIIPQIIMTVILVILFHHEFKKNRQLRAEINAKKAAEEAERLAKEKEEQEAALRATIREIVTEVLSEQKQLEQK